VKRPLWVALVAVLAFAGIVIARRPAEWVLPRSHGGLACAAIDGSLWNGTCIGLTMSGTPIGDVGWQLQPLPLLLARLSVRLTVQGAANASTDLEVSLGGRITARNLRGDLPLDGRLIPGLPANLRGRAHLELALAEIRRGAVTELQGRIEARDLEDRSGNDTPLGSYELSFPGGSGLPTGKLHDLEGPLALEGTLRLTPQPGFELEGFIAPRSGAAPELVNNIRFLGSPDATGRRPFSLSGTF
jgi:general secretion pathway protein N